MLDPLKRNFHATLIARHTPRGLSQTLLKISGGSGAFRRDVLRGLSESELLIAGS
jgi:hypothetical protein